MQKIFYVFIIVFGGCCNIHFSQNFINSQSNTVSFLDFYELETYKPIKSNFLDRVKQGLRQVFIGTKIKYHIVEQEEIKKLVDLAFSQGDSYEMNPTPLGRAIRTDWLMYGLVSVNNSDTKHDLWILCVDMKTREAHIIANCNFYSKGPLLIDPNGFIQFIEGDCINPGNIDQKLKCIRRQVE